MINVATKMKVRLEHISFYLLISTLLLAIALADALTCPEHCSCSEVQRKRYTYNHAKCTSLDGLRKLGKTSDLHSLDLSSLNLTKITNQLDKLTNLSRLDLADNRLSEINALSTKRIRVLNLSGNRITSGKLAKIPSTVKSLNLTNNDITILSEHFKHFVHLRSLELADNPLNCTCETLDIRNWLQERQVWTEKPIKCTAPFQSKGWSWLQARQSEVCDPNGIETPRMLPFSDQSNDPSENDLMMGDDPNVHSQSDEIAEGFIPVNVQRSKRKDFDDDDISEDSDFGEGSGSGDNSDESVTTAYGDSTYEPTHEGSGYDMPTARFIDDDDQISNKTLPGEDEAEDSDGINMESLPDENTSVEPEDSYSTVPPVVEEAIVPVKNVPNDAEYIAPADDNEKEGTRSEQTKIDDSEQVQKGNSTYILLAVLGVLLVVLILYVAAKRSKTNTKNRRNNNDIESPAQEMLTMDKNNLGKPVQSPVEFIPLIPDKNDGDKKPNLCNGEEPLLQKLTEVENENEPRDDDRHQTQQSNGNAKPVRNGVQNGLHPDNKSDDNAVHDDQRQYQPISPKPSRYSPVSITRNFSKTKHERQKNGTSSCDSTLTNHKCLPILCRIQSAEKNAMTTINS